MSKVCKIFLSVFLFSTVLLVYSPQGASAEGETAACTPIFYDPGTGNVITPNRNMGDLSIRINTEALPTGKYRVGLCPPEHDNSSCRYGVGGGWINLQPSDPENPKQLTGVINISKTPSDWRIGNYLFVLGPDTVGYPTKDRNLCSISFPIEERPAQTGCIAAIEQTNLDPSMGAVLKVQGVPTDKYDIVVDGVTTTSGKPTRTRLVRQNTLPAERLTLAPDNYPGFPVGSYTISIKKNGRDQCNQMPFIVTKPGAVAPPLFGPQKSCKLYVEELPTQKGAYTVGTSLAGLPPNQEYTAMLLNNDQPVTSATPKANINGLVATRLPDNVSQGNYTIKITEKDKTDNIMCKTDFNIPDVIKKIATKGCGSTDEKGEIVCTSTGLESKCDAANAAIRGPAVKTAIGCIHTNPAELVKDLMTFIIGISGGLAFLLMILGAFQMLTSAGNPETLHAGRERLTSAIIGLLIVIFATLLLQIIGFDILQIPGFKR